MIGSGAYGTVYQALEMSTGRVFAAKEALVSSEICCSAKLRWELDICKSLAHPSIVSFLGYSMSNEALHIFMELMPGGSIASVLQDFGKLQAKVLQRATRDAANGLRYLHGRSPPIVHRDVKGANLLVDVDFTVKLTDFGCSKEMECSRTFTTVGSVPWMAPEVILQESGYNCKADIWSLGCTVVEMATADTPWGKGRFSNVICALHMISMSSETPPIPEDLLESGKAFVAACLQRDPQARPSADDLSVNPFLRYR